MSETKLLLKLGDKIRKSRQLNKMTQLELAKKSGLDKQTIHRIEKGEINMTINTLFKIAKCLKFKMLKLN